VITTKLGRPVDPRNFYRAFQTRCRRAGVPTTTVHATRKACASLLVALDVHPRLAMQILRRSQIAVTMDVYSQVTSDSTLRALSERLEGHCEHHHPPAPLLYFAAVFGYFEVSSGGESDADKVR
jgi:integrase